MANSNSPRKKHAPRQQVPQQPKTEQQPDADTQSKQPANNSSGQPANTHSFRLDERGLHHLSRDGEHESWNWVSSAIEGAGLAVDEHGNNSSLVVEFRDLDGQPKTHVLPRSSFAGRGNEVVKPLLDAGFNVSSHRNAPGQLREYLMQSRPPARYLLIYKPGWYENNAVFGLPDRTFGESKRRLLYNGSPNHLLGIRGAFEEWLENICTYANGNTRLMFGISLAFAAVLLGLTEEESGAFHFMCNSSKGKSTVLLASGSVAGGGSKLGFAHSWLMTPNALETACEAHNDLLLPMDELKLCDPIAAGRHAYMIASGQGKSRSGWSNNSIHATPQANWRTICLSTGEISLQTHVESAAEKAGLYGGQFVRFVEIPAIADPELGIFNTIPNGFKDAAAFADKLSKASRKLYGTPLRKFLAGVIARRDHHKKQASDTIADFTNEAADVLPAHASSEIHRVAKHFAQGVAGGLAGTEEGCTDWNRDEVWDTGMSMFREWLGERGTYKAMDEERAVRHVRHLIETQQARFVSALEDGERVRDQLGYRKVDEKTGLTLFLVSPENWTKVFCKGLNQTFVTKTLHCRGYLLTNNSDRLQFSARVPGFEKTQKFYAVSEAILQNDED